MVQAVGGGADEPGFSYTIGLNDRDNHPEILVFALPVSAARSLLGNLVRLIEDGDQPLPLRSLIDDIANYPVQLIPILRPYRTGQYTFFNVARAYYEAIIVDAVQLVWPDEAGRFPWTNGFDERYRVPLLDQPGLSKYIAHPSLGV